MCTLLLIVELVKKQTVTVDDVAPKLNLLGSLGSFIGLSLFSLILDNSYSLHVKSNI